MLEGIFERKSIKFCTLLWLDGVWGVVIPLSDLLPDECLLDNWVSDTACVESWILCVTWCNCKSKAVISKNN